MEHPQLYVIIMSIVWLNVKELLAWSMHHTWNLSDSNEIRTHNHLVCKWTLNHLAKSDVISFFGHIFFIKKILKYFNDFQNQNLSVLWLKWT